MTTANGWGRAVRRNGSRNGIAVGLNGAPINRVGSDHPSGRRDWIPELTLAWDPPPSGSKPPEEGPLWPPAATGAWPDVAQHELDSERSRLDADIEAAKARTIAARQRHTKVRSALRAEVIASQRSLAEMEREHGVTMARIRATAQAEVARILAEARQDVAEGSQRALSPDPERTDHAQ